MKYKMKTVVFSSVISMTLICVSNAGLAQNKKKEKKEKGPEYFLELKARKGAGANMGVSVYDLFRSTDPRDDGKSLTEEEYEIACKNVEKTQNVIVPAAVTCFDPVYDFEAFSFARENGAGVVSSYKVNWNPSTKQCRLNVSISGMKNGNTFARSTSCWVSGFVVGDDGSVKASRGSNR